MPYYDHFRHADDVISHLDTIVPSLTDPLLQLKYTGFVTVAAVTVYELAIKNVFIDFSTRKHKILRNFSESFFERINGRIKLKAIREDYISKYGNKYLEKFNRNLRLDAASYLRSHHRDILNSYGNMITWRNDFAHQAQLASNATYNEVIQAYKDGKEVIHCLARSMTR